MGIKRSVAWAGLAGVLVAWTSYKALAPTGAPLGLTRLAADSDLDELGYRGGVRASYRVEESAVGPDQVDKVARLLARRAGSAGTVADVSIQDHEITLAVAGIGEAEAEAAARGLTRRGQLGFQRVVAGARTMKQLYERAEHLGTVQAGVDYWTHEDRHFYDYYLEADTRTELEAFLSAASDDPRIAPEPGHQIAFERVPSRIGDAHWRTHYLESAPVLDNRDIDSAWAGEDPMTGTPAVILHFKDPGSRRWAEFTANHLGEKVAIVLDGTVLSAPTIQAPIRSGEAMITMGSWSDSMAEAEILARSLMDAASASAALEWPLTVTALEYIPRRVSPDALTTARAIYALLLGMAMFALVFVVDVRVSRRAPDRDRTDASGERAWPVVPLLVSLGAAVAVYFLPELPLPGVHHERAAKLLQSGPGSEDAGLFSVAALGIMPIVSAFVLVELAALIVPAWRPLRHAGPGARARLGKATIIVSLIFALVQGYGMARLMADMGGDVVPNPGMSFVLVATLTLATGVALYWLVAALVSRHGIGNGFALILFVGLLGQAKALYPILEHLDLGSVDMVLVAAAVAGVMAATSGFLRVGKLSMPTCGIVPIMYATSLLTLAELLALAGWSGPLDRVMALAPGRAGPGVGYFVVIVVLAVVLSWLFSRPSLLAGEDRPVRQGDAERSQYLLFWIAVAMSAVYLLCVGAVHMAAADRVAALPALPALLMAPAIAMDLLAEWRARRRHRDLVSVWPLHRVQATAPALSALRSAGIEGHARGRYFRALFHFFAPFVAIEIMVPSAHADQARELLRKL